MSLIIPLFLVIVGLGGSGWYISQHQKLQQAPSTNMPASPQSSVNPAAISASLILKPQKTPVKKGEETVYNAEATITQGLIAAVDVNLTFDPHFIEIKDITPGPLFQNPTVFSKTIDNQAGKIHYALGSLTPVETTKQNLVFTISVKTLTQTNTREAGIIIVKNMSKIGAMTKDLHVISDSDKNVMFSETPITILP